MKRRNFIFNSTKALAIGLVVPRQLLGSHSSGAAVWHVEQFSDKGLAQFSYALLYNNKILLIDPARDAAPFYEYARKNNAEIVGVIETHPHADFISAHAEIQRNKNVPVYLGRKVGASFKHHALDANDRIPLYQDLHLRVLDTPGHSPDSISLVLADKDKDLVVFSGDALLFGDVGRPDLREYKAGKETERIALAKAMYHTVHQKFARLADEVILYPAHGAGSLCGGNIRDVSSSTIGYERQHNYAFKKYPEAEFVALLLKDLPFIPKYFPYDVELNKKGAADLKQGLSEIKLLPDNFITEDDAVMVDGRSNVIFNASFLDKAIHIPDGLKFETWLGTVIAPSQKFYIVGENPAQLNALSYKAAKIGYESAIKGAFVFNKKKPSPAIVDKEKFDRNTNDYYILDVREAKEVKDKKVFEKSVNIPLSELSGRLKEIPLDKPVVVHCASGYRSAIASSLLRYNLNGLLILDLGEAVQTYK
ncbi:MBL fold metallo-hydrolase [Pedobacter heparinus]|uniref:MBL fold metallo-hydrolase n=1 Tax=Pedobacter heparinus TaxID=984 RepID=UPI00292DFFEB|nr:MBL fold metallo-hydrolase [Pedobacter heparinus]